MEINHKGRSTPVSFCKGFLLPAIRLLQNHGLQDAQHRQHLSGRQQGWRLPGADALDKAGELPVIHVGGRNADASLLGRFRSVRRNAGRPAVFIEYDAVVPAKRQNAVKGMTATYHAASAVTRKPGY